MFLSWLRSWRPPKDFVLISMIMIFIGLIVFNIANGIASASWPSVDGTITRSEMYTSSEDQSTSPYITYDFTVNDHRYTSETISFGISSHVLERYPKGRVVQVYYNPLNPSLSVLEPGLGIENPSPTDKIVLLVLGIALLGIIVALWKILIPKKRPQQDL